jgi:hypothetical protein
VARVKLPLFRPPSIRTQILICKKYVKNGVRGGEIGRSMILQIENNCIGSISLHIELEQGAHSNPHL